MKLKFTALLTGLVALAQPVLAADIDVSKLPPPSDRKDVTYDKDIQPILKASCFNCHGEQRPRAAGVRLDSVEAIMKGGQRDLKVITPGKSETSLLVIAVSRLDPKTAMPPAPRAPRGGMGGTNGPAGGTNNATGTNMMPPAGGPPPAGRGGPPAKPLTAEEVGLIRAWIDQGAK